MTTASPDTAPAATSKPCGALYVDDKGAAFECVLALPHDGKHAFRRLTTAPSPCPSWCKVPAEEHAEEWYAEGDSETLFHRSADHDRWERDYKYSPNEVSVRLETYVSPGNPDDELIIIDGDLGHGSEKFYEVTVADAERLANALLAAIRTARGEAQR